MEDQGQATSKLQKKVYKRKETKRVDFPWYGFIILLACFVMIVYMSLYFIKLFEQAEINITFFVFHSVLLFTAIGFTLFSFFRWGKL